MRLIVVDHLIQDTQHWHFVSLQLYFQTIYLELMDYYNQLPKTTMFLLDDHTELSLTIFSPSEPSTCNLSEKMATAIFHNLYPKANLSISILLV